MAVVVPSTSSSYGVEEKLHRLHVRREDSKKLGARIDQIVYQAETGNTAVGCAGGICRLLSRVRGRTTPVSSDVALTDSLAVNRAVFGLAGAGKKDPAAKLDEAAAVMRARIQQLETRAGEQRAEAQRLVKAGQKAAAMRALKKARAIEAQVEANHASVTAVEQQVDILAQHAMQKTLSSALASTSKVMKKDAKAIGKAEKAIDDASDARDMANDLNAVMADFAGGATADLDEDDLLAELDAMARSDEQPPPDEGQAQSVAVATLEAKIACKMIEREHSEDVRATVAAMPAAPTAARKMEKVRLLESA